VDKSTTTDGIEKHENDEENERADYAR